MQLKKIAVAVAAAWIAVPAMATNGMNMEGYGPVATAMGGASFAYDNGTAGVINNPATLGFMAAGTSRLDVALGGLHPDVSSQGKDSSANSFFMPAAGYVRKDGNIAWGAGMMAQGGMGTKYSNAGAFGSPLLGMNFATGQGYGISDPGFENKSEVGVGRLIFPLSYSVNNALNVGASIDYVWAGMDIRWLIDGVHFGSMMMPGGKLGWIDGSMKDGFMGAAQQGMFSSLDWGYFNFNTDSTFSQKAKSNGWAGNLGFTYVVSPQLTIGGVYHAKTRLDDMTTDNAAMGTFAVSGGMMGTGQVIPIVGKVTIRNFQWPETYGIGMAFKASDQLTVVADYKRVNWADVMKSFNMVFTANGTQSNPMAQGFAGSTMNVTYYQNWKNQDVVMVGAAYAPGGALTYRGGINYASNPIPDEYVSPLFPAITKLHIMGGVGYRMSKAASLDFSLVYVPKVTVTNRWASSVGGAGSNQEISMSQLNWQAMYSHRF
jgi:long-chain fatty acid transport protein